MTMRIIFQKSHSSFRKANGHESRIRLDWMNRISGASPSTVHPPVYVKGYNQFFEELDFPSFAMGSREINRVEGFAENIWTGN